MRAQWTQKYIFKVKAIMSLQSLPFNFFLSRKNIVLYGIICIAFGSTLLETNKENNKRKKSFIVFVIFVSLSEYIGFFISFFRLKYRPLFYCPILPTYITNTVRTTSKAKRVELIP